jgi:hypothetical protein
MIAPRHHRLGIGENRLDQIAAHFVREGLSTQAAMGLLIHEINLAPGEL